MIFNTYSYDALYRLTSAGDTDKSMDTKSASYTLAIGYDNMHRITSKKQHLSKGGLQFVGGLDVGYDLTYTYGNSEGKKFQLDNVRDINYRIEKTVNLRIKDPFLKQTKETLVDHLANTSTDSTNINNGHKYMYDANGNLVYINTSRVKKDGIEDKKVSEQKCRWDEENRLLATDENGFVANYWYDADGERTVKSSGENEEIYVNSDFSGGRTNTVNSHCMLALTLWQVRAVNTPSTSTLDHRELSANSATLQAMVLTHVESFMLAMRRTASRLITRRSMSSNSSSLSRTATRTSVWLIMARTTTIMSMAKGSVATTNH